MQESGLVPPSAEDEERPLSSDRTQTFESLTVI